MLFAKYNQNDEVKEDKTAVHVACMGEEKNAYLIWWEA
jgi:hypothetical protein